MAAGGFRALPRTVWLLGFASLFTDLSSSLIYGLLPLFLVSDLGASVLLVGLIDGVAEATASFGKIYSGVLSDWLGRRKGLAVLGYALSGAAKLLFPIAASAGGILLARFVDRLGKGVRGAPRDALVADVTPPPLLGAAYGLRQSLDEAGTFIGPLAAAGLMLLFADDVRLVFWLACIPAMISVAILVLGVREPERRTARAPESPLRLAGARRLGRGYWLCIAALFVMFLPRFTDAFYLLRGQTLGLAPAEVPLLLAAMSTMTTFLTAPLGRWSDRVGRRLPVLIGFALLLLSHLVLAVAWTPAVVFVGAALFGLHFALTQAVLSALVADLAPADLRGTAFGVFHLMSGLAILIGSSAAGWLWDAAGAGAMFALAAAVSLLGLAAFLALPAHRTRRADAG
jgi:MFS family permease